MLHGEGAKPLQG